jgi:crotonobetainyl-CoA:carnitine CoA-transferase CaiB-like acyl-CoA transferase
MNDVSPEPDKAPMPLAGIRVLELSHIIAGPTAGQILGDLGADVVKIESVDGGDQARGAPGSNSAVFEFLNRNKRSVALNLKGEGRDVFLKLVETVDIVVDNFAYGVVDSLGVGFKASRSRNKGLIWLSVKGFLPGPAESRPLLDELAQMMGGLAFMTGPTGQPMRAGASIIDVGAATYGVIGIFAALRQREATGLGQHITAGLYETSVYWVGQWMAIAQQSGQQAIPMPEMRQGQRMGWGVYRLFETSDNEQVFIGLTSNAQWERFCKEFEQHELLADPRLQTNRDRVAHRHELAQKIASIIKKIGSGDLQQRLEAAKVPFAPLRRPDQLVDEPQLHSTGQLMEMESKTGKLLRLPKLPVKADQIDFTLRRGPPLLGEHTREVLLEAGFTVDDIGRLTADGSIGCAEQAGSNRLEATHETGKRLNTPSR